MTQPRATLDVGPDLVGKLLRAQHPDLARLPLGRSFHGWDNVITRLGEQYAVRTPRIAESVGSLRKELLWLPRLRKGWTFPAPVPVAAGEPGEGYPWPWSVVTWVPGKIWAEDPWDASAAVPFAAALREVHVTPRSVGPGPGAGEDLPENAAETMSPAEREPGVRSLLARLRGGHAPDGRRFDSTGAEHLWRAAVAASPPSEPVFIHADVHLLNVVSLDGAFGGITDWGDLCVGDPAVDLGRAAMLLPDPGAFTTFLDAYGVDGALEARTRGLGLAAAMRLAAMDAEATNDLVGTDRSMSPAARSGWHGLGVLGVLT